jgi:exonuclease VII small subunit
LSDLQSLNYQMKSRVMRLEQRIDKSESQNYELDKSIKILKENLAEKDLLKSIKFIEKEVKKLLKQSEKLKTKEKIIPQL